MLEDLVRFSVRRRGVVVILAILVAAIAAGAVSKLSIDAVPDVTNVQVSILTSAPGLSPAEVEQYITYPIETAMNGLPDVTEIRSVSRTAVSSVTVIFRDHVNVWFARQLVSERLKLAELDIPPGYGHPELAPVSTGVGEIYEFYLESTDGRHSPMDLRTLLDWVVAYKLRSVPGVIEVNAMGGEAKQYQVIVDPKRLAAYRVTLGTIYEMLRRNNANIGGGYIEKNRESYVIRGEAQYQDPRDIGNTVITTDEDGTPVLLKQLATVKLGPALRFGTVTMHGRGEIVAGTVMMLIGQNSREVVKNVKKKLKEIEQDLPAGVKLRSYYDRADFINRMLKTVFINLAEGAALVVLVLFLTLGTLRGSIIAALAIPLSMGVAVLGMVQLEVTGNLMSLGAIDFGLLVDGSIVMLEAAMVQLIAAQERHSVDVPATVAYAMSRSARAVTFAVAIIMLVYLPLMALEGVEGRMFKPMAITVALALFGAVVFSLTVFPALSAFFLRPPKHAAGHHEAGFWGWLSKGYSHHLERALKRPLVVTSLAVGLLALTAVAGSTLGAEFVPRLEEGQLSLDIRRLPSISISEAQRLGVQVEQVLARFPEVNSIVTRTGRPEVATEPVGPDETEVMVQLKEKEEWQTAHDLDGLGEKIKEAVEREVPGTFVSVSQPIEDRVNQLLAGSRADVVVKVFGPDLAVSKGLADRIGEIMRSVPGTGDLRVQRVLGLPLLNVKVDRLRLARYGIPADEVLAIVEASRVGRNVGWVFEGPRRFDLTLLLPPAQLTPESFGELLVGTSQGQLVPLAQVADIRESEGPAVINREGLERRVMVEANIRGRDLVSYVHEAQMRVHSQLKLPQGYHLEWGGQFENFTRAKNRLKLVVPMALGIIFGMLFLMFGDARYAVAVFACVPLGVVGGVFSLLVRGLPFSIPAAVGFIALCGVAVLNGVVMASDLKRRLDDGLHLDEALHGAAQGSLRPIMTTALVAAIGFVPMAISTRAGAEVQRPLATVVIGGIISSTALMLFVLPVVLRKLVRPSAQGSPALSTME
ncbi:MAG: CusA/CzcA family heavy metal efflux RND transporter [Myxococcales bacterium]|nr:CusA/CzcA family heavy metal efflux RND transporter [Myxococcota bacterium]MDW8283204.1 CusA/CzcA family heavy metal efflux RND transporter [Myxococcales bacterium]